MDLTEWKEEKDKSYWQCFYSLKSFGLEPIFKIRCVKLIDGNYEAVVRDYKSGKMLASRRKGVNKGYPLKNCKRISLHLVRHLFTEQDYEILEYIANQFH